MALLLALEVEEVDLKPQARNRVTDSGWKRGGNTSYAESTKRRISPPVPELGLVRFVLDIQVSEH